MAIPLLIAGGVAAAAAAAKGAVAAAGAGKNRRAAQAFYDPSGKTGYNANASNWGGTPGGLQQYTGDLHNSQVNAEGRQGPQVNYNQANAWENQSMQARNAQGQAAGLMMNRATGATPSIAQQQGQIATNRAIAESASQGASGRGAAGIAMAQRNAAGNAALAQSRIANDTAVAAANERLQAEQAAFGAFSGMRQGDQASQGQAAQQQQFQGQIDMQNRAQNDARAMQYEQLKYGANQSQLQSKMQEQGILAGSHNAKEGLQQQTAQANANREGQQVDSIINGISSAASSMGGGAAGGMGSDERMKVQYRAAGGPIAAGMPYVVGEKGPELVVPKQAGTVIPAGATKALLGKGGGRKPPTTKEMLDDRYEQNKPVDQGGPSLDDMLDDRARQTAPADEDGIGKDALHTGIENQIIADRQQNTQAARDADAVAQWERINGPVADAERDARQRDNHIEMQKTQARLGTGGRGSPWYMTPVQGLSMTGGAPTQMQSGIRGGSVWAGGNTFESDDRAKLKEAFQAGVLYADGDPSAQTVPSYMQAPKPELKPKNKMPGTWQTKENAQTDTPNRAAPSAMPPGPTSGIAHPPVQLDRGPIADANRAMRGEPYSYRPEHTPPHEQPGQPHFGFMAQNLERNPVSATAVEEGPDGMKRVDRDRMLQVMASGISDLQRQQDELRAGLSKGGRKSKAA